MAALEPDACMRPAEMEIIDLMCRPVSEASSPTLTLTPPLIYHERSVFLSFCSYYSTVRKP